jgi:deoxyguanosine kinase
VLASRRPHETRVATDLLPFRYLAVDGPIGVGKTSLVDRLVRRFEAVKVLEDVENPFLPDFYQDKAGAAFQTQMYFLLSRFKQQQEVVQHELFHRLVVADYIFQKDRIFAYLTLGDDELALYDKLYATLEPSIPVPDLVLYLTADVDTCIARIRKRARGFEREISEDYMAELIDAYNHYFHYYTRSPLLVVETSHLNLVGKGGDFDELVEQLKRPVRGTEYFTSARRR